jgi:Fe-S cluster assembly protein SufD
MTVAQESNEAGTGSARPTARTAAVERWQQLFEQQGVASSLPEAIARRKNQAMVDFLANGFPTIRDEEWRFTNVASIAKGSFSLATASRITEAEVAPFRYAGGRHLVFLNGVFQPHVSDIEASDLIVDSLGSRLAAGRDEADALQHVGAFAPTASNAFTALNMAFSQDGALIRIPKGRHVEEPIHCLYLSRATDSVQPEASFPRTLVVAEQNSQCQIIESFIGLPPLGGPVVEGKGIYFTAPVTEFVVHENAVVDHYKLQKETLEGKHMATQQVWLARSANYSSHSIQHGGQLVRTDVNAVLDGEGIECHLNGLYILAGKQHVDNHMLVEHVKPHCYSHELYKGILNERARAVFSGRIYVHKGAQKTDAVQNNRNLLLSKNAMVNSNPQLEIFADDVRCTHGSTTGHLEEEAMFYLRSRGIPLAAATSLLTYAFASEFIERVKFEPLKRDLNEFLFSRLPGGEIVRDAIL